MVLKYKKKTHPHSRKKKRKIMKSQSHSHRKIIKRSRRKRMSVKKKGIFLDSGKNTDKNTYDIITLANCPYCSKLIRLLEEKHIKYNKLEIENNDIEKKNICNLFVKKVFKMEHNTFPKIFINGKFIGGLDKFSNIFKD